MPAAPSLRGSEHSTPATHVAERTLAGPVRASSSDSGNPGDGSSGSPGGGRGLFARSHVDAVRLARVLHHFIVNKRHDVWTDGGLEYCRQVDSFIWNNCGVSPVDGNDRSGRHLLSQFINKKLNFSFLRIFLLKSSSEVPLKGFGFHQKKSL